MTSNRARKEAKVELEAHKAELEEIREGIRRMRRTYEELQWIEDRIRMA